MSRPFVLAHVSDLHVSTFGDTFHDRGHLVKRSMQPVAMNPAKHELCWEGMGWQVWRERLTRAQRIVLVDPGGYSHRPPRPHTGDELTDPLERTIAKARRLEERRAASMAKALPSPEALEPMMKASIKNTNLRLVQAVRAVEAADVDAVLITGDLTDDGDGYELVEAAFERWTRNGRLLAISGNHDLYVFPMVGSARPRPTALTKREAWRNFTARIGLKLEDTGAWCVPYPEANTCIVGLESCMQPQPRFFRHNGAIGPAQLEYLRTVAQSPEWTSARHRIIAFHHHVVPLPHGIGRRAPPEIGMRLDDAREVARTLNEIGATFVLHGHRHISEERQPAGCNFRLLASPSLTLGCKSGDAPSFWRIELAERAHVTRVHVPLTAV